MRDCEIAKKNGLFLYIKYRYGGENAFVHKWMWEMRRRQLRMTSEGKERERERVFGESSEGIESKSF